MENVQKVMQIQPKKNKLRMPYEKNGAQAVILGVVIFCLIFSFIAVTLFQRRLGIH